MMRTKTQTMIVALVAALLALPASMAAASDPAERTRLLEVENRALRSQIASMRKELASMRQEIARLKARPTATTQPSTRPAKRGVYLAGPVIRGNASIGVLRAIWGPATGAQHHRERLGVILVLEITNQNHQEPLRCGHLAEHCRLVDNMGRNYCPLPGVGPLFYCASQPNSWIAPGDKEINVLLFSSRVVSPRMAKTLILTLNRPGTFGTDTPPVKFTIPVDRVRAAPNRANFLHITKYREQFQDPNSARDFSPLPRLPGTQVTPDVKNP